MGKVAELSTQDFAQAVETSDGTVVVDFTATWCGPCKMLAPVFERVADKYEGRAKFFKLDIDQNVEVAAKYGVTTIPNLLFFKDGQVVGQSIGFIAEGQLSSKVDDAIES